MKTIIAYTDGEARGNPGPAAVGVYITTESGEVVREASKEIGNASHEFAQYYAVAFGLETLKEIYGDATVTTQFQFRLDNELVQKQLSGVCQIKEPGLVPLFIEIHNQRVASFPQVTFTHVPREQNKEAARLVCEVLDGK